MRRATFGLLAAVLTAAGCAKHGDSPTGLVPVKGKVLSAGGEPLAGVQVMFYPTAPGGTSGGGNTAADGTFAAKSLNNEDGLVPGSYKVTVVPAKNRGARVPEKYAEEHTTDLTADVPEGGGQVTVRLK